MEANKTGKQEARKKVGIRSTLVNGKWKQIKTETW